MQGFCTLLTYVNQESVPALQQVLGFEVSGLPQSQMEECSHAGHAKLAHCEHGCPTCAKFIPLMHLT